MNENKLETYQLEREKLLQQITKILKNDSRVVAAWLFGSLGRGDADGLSDVDIWVVVDDTAVYEIIEQRQQYVAQISPPVLFVEAPQNAPENGGYLMVYYDMPSAPIQVDWYWQPQSLAHTFAETKLLFDRIGLPHDDLPVVFPHREPVTKIIETPLHFISFFWAMLMICGKYAARRPQAKKMQLLPYVLEPFNKVQRLLGKELLTDFMPHPSFAKKLLVLRQLANGMDEMMSQVATLEHEVPVGAATAVNKYLDLLEVVLI